MQKNSRFDKAPPASGALAVPLLGVSGARVELRKPQKRFNQLVAKLKGQRDELARWSAYRRHYQGQLADIYQPMVNRLREQRIAMVKVLDQALDGTDLGKRERDKATYIFHELLSSLLAVEEDQTLIQLHDKYSAVSFAELQRERMDALRAAANASLDIDADAYRGVESPAAFEVWLEDELRAAHDRAADAAEPSRSKRQKSSKGEALRAGSAAGASGAVRDTYRKLVSELHPDREVDVSEQVRKTELMQRVNQAYKAGDLLGLLELQLSVEQIDPAALSVLADEQLAQYSRVLEQQSRRLRDELMELTEPFAALLEGVAARKVTTDAVQRLLDKDIRDVKVVLRKAEMDLICFRDIRQLQQSLSQYRIDPLDDDELDMPDDFEPSTVFRPRRRRRR